jgi:hypothetical protein
MNFGKPEGIRPVAKAKCRCEDNIKMDVEYNERV